MALSQLAHKPVHTVRYSPGPTKHRLPAPKNKKGAPKSIRKYKSSDEDANLKMANEIREIYGLPPLEQAQKPEVIRDLEGMMQEYSSGENPVDAVKESRISQ